MPGMKVYTTDEKELIMEPLVKWAGNPNITVAVKAFGLRVTVQVYISTSWPFENRVYGLNCVGSCKSFQLF